MSWSIGYDNFWKRDIGYGVPAWCDFPGCNAVIDRGLAFVCGGEPYGGTFGCGLYFCGLHKNKYCERCNEHKPPFSPKPEHPNWVKFKLKDKSWKAWRKANPEECTKLHGLLK
jgi:hypothetical protein